ncbi:MAG: sigma-70 family RNA polymerase sigma factor [Reyranellaceae bacterium]
MTTMQAAMPGSFGEQLIAALPRLHRVARSMTRDRDRANDLVQETTLKALLGKASFRAGTNFAAWIHRIQRNEFISGLRRARPLVALDPEDAALPSHRPRQEVGLVMREFLTAFAQLPRQRRSALLLAAVAEQPYSEIAAHAGVSVGTIKSRVWRGRQTLKQLLPD